ncbi:MAG: AbrB/MazE/SpoVT family DNA-binding domain-containing protein [Armatimonadetes bacterium]|nr:AbrB/MazE/SpoVT family DNA-binding domain-containing protein [Armatimonadota bacterium]
MPIIRVSAKGQVVIPAEFRKKHGIKPGTYCFLHVQNGVLHIIPRPENIVESLRGCMRKFGTESLTAELLRERALDNEREERKYQRMFGPKPEAVSHKS